MLKYEDLNLEYLDSVIWCNGCDKIIHSWPWTRDEIFQEVDKNHKLCNTIPMLLHKDRIKNGSSEEWVIKTYGIDYWNKVRQNTNNNKS
jgi:hypothetical protein